MRVKIAELKTHLSKYVQSVRQGGGPIEVCVRDQPVAYLSSAGVSERLISHEQDELVRRLGRRGLHLRQLGKVSTISLSPVEPGDGRKFKNTIVAMRSEKNW